MAEAKLLADRYEVGELIGQGGMAEVHLGKDTRLGRKVAIKILKTELASDPVFLARFRREAQASASLNHPAIVAVYDTGEETELSPAGADVHIPYIVMEFVDGRTVRDILQAEGQLTLGDAVEITQGVLSALEYSHKVGIIHRDIKPGNVMITSTGAVKVMDFGIARAMVDSAATMTQSQGVVGTAQYLSPEQARGERVDSRSDLYSVGCLLFELLTGRPPFVGDSPVSIAYQHVREVPPLVTDFNPDIPASISAVISKALEKDVNRRYASASEFLTDLNAAAEGRPTTAGDRTQVLSPEEMAKLSQENNNPNQKNDVTTIMPFDSEDYTDDINSTGTMSKEDLEAEQKKKKFMIIGGVIVGAVVVIAIIALIVSGLLNGSKDGGEKRTVPMFSSSTTSDQYCERVQAQDLKCNIVDDNDSTSAKGTITKVDPKGGTSVDKGATISVYVSTGPAQGTIPSVAGMSESDAKDALTNLGFDVKVGDLIDCQLSANSSDSATSDMYAKACDNPKDTVVGSDPASGSSDVTKGSTVTIYEASGNVLLPSLVGKTKDDANSILSELKLTGNFTEQETDDTTQVGKVISTDPSSKSVAQKTSINVVIGKASSKVTISLNGANTLAKVKAALDKLGLKYTITADVDPDQKGDTKGEFASLDPQDGSTVDKTAIVTIHVFKSSYKASSSSDSDDSDSSSGGSGSSTTK
ncbi:MAG: Stk1 family PASTA domain-containing Ser/Thr kinase [Candidatus Ancillula sp.]|jgi:serine/threonine-protein kinase|nr:Stk1 family PASTA domain-containing Ser/Thr kinase [Candidatus Ancillula sp.]